MIHLSIGNIRLLLVALIESIMLHTVNYCCLREGSTRDAELIVAWGVKQ